MSDGSAPKTSVRLSPREIEVAGMVAEGLTNREIAARLFISERTADGHLEHIREKLGVNTRAQVTAWVVRQESAPIMVAVPAP
ncbi:MAG: helix-turn-helix transcriptional regulator, partial [Chloroflexi bacterium]